MSKGLERLNNKNLPCSNCKELKALAIIKNKKVCIVWLRNGLSTYNSTASLYELPRLTQEEYDFLKEVLL